MTKVLAGEDSTTGKEEADEAAKAISELKLTTTEVTEPAAAEVAAPEAS